ncbi:MAG: hypothetical protein WDN69_21720 [Aliidongia sp.]
MAADRPHDAAAPVGADDVARGKCERRLVVPAREDYAVRSLLDRLDKMAASQIHSQFQGTVFENRRGRRLRQEQNEGKARVEH